MIFNMNEEFTLSDLRISGVYKIQNKINSKCYIGYSKNILLRVMQHLIRSHNYLLRKDMRIFGRDNFTVTILEKVYSKESLKQREEFYIKQYDACNIHKGYNIVVINNQALEHEINKKGNRNISPRTCDLIDFTKLEETSKFALVKGASIRVRKECKWHKK